MRISDEERDCSLFRLMPMIQKLTFSCWDKEKYPYTRSQLTLIMALLQKDSMTMKEAASYISSSKEQATRAVAPLVENGLLERYTDPVNRNYVHIRLTESGLLLVREMLTDFYNSVSSLLNHSLTPDEQEKLHNSLTESILILQKVVK